MIIQLTKVNLNMEFGQNQSKIKQVMTVWNVSLQIENKTGGRFSDHQKAKKKKKKKKHIVTVF